MQVENIEIRKEHQQKLLEMVITSNDTIDNYLEKLYLTYTYEIIQNTYRLNHLEKQIIYCFCQEKLKPAEIAERLRISIDIYHIYKNTITAKFSVQTMLEVELAVLKENIKVVKSIDNYFNILLVRRSL